MRQTLVGASSPVWDLAPDVARVLFSSWCSGVPQFVACGDAIVERMLGSEVLPHVEPDPSTVVHILPHQARPPLAPYEVYVGNGVQGCECSVPSIWSDPLAEVDVFHKSGEKLAYSEYMDARLDWKAWLSPLVGKTLVCTCTKQNCHAVQLSQGVNVPLQQQLESETDEENDEKEDYYPNLLEDSDEEPEEREWDQPEVSSKTLWAANETLGQPKPSVDRKPSWPASWHWLIAQIRAATTLIFWEIFAGCTLQSSLLPRVGRLARPRTSCGTRAGTCSTRSSFLFSWALCWREEHDCHTWVPRVQVCPWLSTGSRAMPFGMPSTRRALQISTRSNVTWWRQATFWCMSVLLC